MKCIKPGQFYWHNSVLLRAKKRTNGCNGCVLDSFFVCPNLRLKGRNDNNRPNCEENGIIFEKV